MNKRQLTIFLLVGFIVFIMIACAGQAEETAVATPMPATLEPTATSASSTTLSSSVQAVPTPTEPAPEILDLEIKGFLFRPVTVTVKVGTTVRWTNLDDIQHTITSGTPDNIGGTFDSGFFVQNEAFAYTFNEPGEFPYFCQRHPHMQATIIVEE